MFELNPADALAHKYKMMSSPALACRLEDDCILLVDGVDVRVVISEGAAADERDTIEHRRRYTNATTAVTVARFILAACEPAHGLPGLVRKTAVAILTSNAHA